METNSMMVYEKLKISLLEFLALNNKQGVVGANDISMETRIAEDLGVDSIEMMDLASMLDVKFNLKIEPAEFMGREKIKDIVELIISKMR